MRVCIGGSQQTHKMERWDVGCKLTGVSLSWWSFSTARQLKVVQCNILSWAEPYRRRCPTRLPAVGPTAMFFDWGNVVQAGLAVLQRG